MGVAARKLMDKPAVSYAYASSGRTSSGTSLTFTSYSFGTAATGRKILVFVSGNNSNASITSVTIGGVSATALFTELSNGGSPVVGNVYIADVPTGATGNIVVNWGATQNNTAIGVYALYGLASSTPYDTDSIALTPTNGNISVTLNYSGGFYIGLVSTQANNTTGWTWTNATEDFDLSSNAGSGRRFAGASSSPTGAGTVTITANSTGNLTPVSIMFGLAFN